MLLAIPTKNKVIEQVKRKQELKEKGVERKRQRQCGLSNNLLADQSNLTSLFCKKVDLIAAGSGKKKKKKASRLNP